MSELLASGIAAHNEPGTPRGSCAFPGVCVLPSGRWLCTFRAAPTKGSTAGQATLLTYSDDQGSTWSVADNPFGDLVLPGRAHNEGKEIEGAFRVANMTALGGDEVLAALAWVDVSQPELPLFNEANEGLLDMRPCLARSHDGGLTYSPPELIDTTPFDCPAPLTGPVLVLQNGEWVLQFELNKFYYDPQTWRHSSVLMFSTDQGRSWPRHAVASNDPDNRVFYWDQRPGVLSDGSLLDLFWTYDNGAATYLNMHARESKDNGHTFSEIWDTGVPGQPSNPVPLFDGRVAMAYVDRSGSPSIKLRCSADGGRSWPDETEVTVFTLPATSQTTEKGSMNDSWSEMAKFSVGLPFMAGLADGDLLVVFYAGPHQDDTSIHWARVRVS